MSASPEPRRLGESTPPEGGNSWAARLVRMSNTHGDPILVDPSVPGVSVPLGSSAVIALKSQVTGHFWHSGTPGEAFCRAAQMALVLDPKDLPYFPSPWCRAGVGGRPKRSNHDHACAQTTKRPSGSQVSVG